MVVAAVGGKGELKKVEERKDGLVSGLIWWREMEINTSNKAKYENVLLIPPQAS